MQSLHLIRESSLWWVCIHFKNACEISGVSVGVDKKQKRRGEKRLDKGRAVT